MQHSLENKVALVTGGATRIGREISLTLARHGCDVAVHYHSNQAGAETVVSEIQKLGRRSCGICADLATSEAPALIRKELRKAFNNLDFLINNASFYDSPDKISAQKSLRDETLTDWERSLNINARAPFFLIQELAPLLEASENGAIVNILDRSIEDPFTDRASHSVSKSALAAITKLAAKTFASKIRVNGLELGSILPGDEMSAEETKRRSWGGTEDVTAGVIFLLKTGFINGEIVPLRGSAHLRS